MHFLCQYSYMSVHFCILHGLPAQYPRALADGVTVSYNVMSQESIGTTLQSPSWSGTRAPLSLREETPQDDRHHRTMVPPSLILTIAVVCGTTLTWGQLPATTENFWAEVGVLSCLGTKGIGLFLHSSPGRHKWDSDTCLFRDPGSVHLVSPPLTAPGLVLPRLYFGFSVLETSFPYSFSLTSASPTSQGLVLWIICLRGPLALPTIGSGGELARGEGEVTR